ncbi:MFS general substrate transporter [Xylariaceae sp. FL0662B]|nr:MFS general substrate transporter [Xylariaceae sp. FL0662B]
MPDGIEKAAHDAEASLPEQPIDEAELNFQPKTLKFWTVMISIFLAMFLVALDRTIIGTAIPQITQEFNSLGDIGWYGSAYQLTTAASQLLFGRVYKFYDLKRTFLLTVLVFETGSALCGAAPSSIAFIIGRALAGLGGAGIFTGTMLIMIPMVPLRKRPAFQGVFGIVFGIASSVGPLLGGAFTDGATWRWCFYINLPIGAVAAACLIFILHLPKEEHKPASVWKHITRLDPLGTAFLVPSIVCLLLALQWGGSTYEWESWRIILLLVLFGVLLFGFVTVQLLMPHTATVPARVLTQRSVFAGTMFMYCVSGSMMMAFYFLPLWFQVVQGTSAIQSGINTLPLVLSLVVASILAGGLTQAIGYYVPSMIVCTSLMAVGLGLMSTFRVVETSAHWIGYQFLTGFGLGTGMQSSSLAAQAVLPKPDIPIGVSIMFFAQQLGGAIFTSVGQNLLSTYMVEHLEQIPGVDPDKVTSSGAQDLVNNVPPAYRPAVKQIYNDAISRINICGMGIVLVAFVASLFMEWKNIKKTGPKAPQVAEAPEEAEGDGSTPTHESQTIPIPESSQETGPKEPSRRVIAYTGTNSPTEQAEEEDFEKIARTDPEYSNYYRFSTMAPESTAREVDYRSSVATWALIENAQRLADQLNKEEYGSKETLASWPTTRAR